MHTIHYIAILLFFCVCLFFFCIRCIFILFLFLCSLVFAVDGEIGEWFWFGFGVVCYFNFLCMATRKKNALCYVIVVVYVWVWDIAYLLLLLVTSKLFLFCSFIPRIWKFADCACMFDFFPLLYPHNRVSVYSFYVGAAVVHARTFICWFQQHIVTVASLM